MAKHHFAGLVIAVALHHRDEDMRQHRGPQHSLRGYLRTTLRALDALPIIATEELKRKEVFMIPGIVTLKVNVPHMRPKLKAFPSRALKATVLRNGHMSSSSSLETLQLLPSPSSPSAPSPRSLASHCSDARGRKRKAEE